MIKLNKKDGTNQNAAKAEGYFSKIFKIENAMAKKSVKERYAKRLELEKTMTERNNFYRDRQRRSFLLVSVFSRIFPQKNFKLHRKFLKKY